MAVINYVKKRRIRFGLIIISSCLLLGFDICEDEDLTKKQVWCEYDAMSGYSSLSFDVFKYELKDADTTRRLNPKTDNHAIDPNPEWLNDSTANGDDSICIFLEDNRSIINWFTDDSQAVYICAVRRMILHRDGRVDSSLSGKIYRDSIHTVYNEAMIAIGVATINDSSKKAEVEPYHNINFTVAHELGHSFNLDHCGSGCIMKTDVPWNIYYTEFCISCRDILGQQRP